MSQLLEIHRDPQKILYIEIYPSELSDWSGWKNTS